MSSLQSIKVAIIGGRDFDDIKYATDCLIRIFRQKNIQFNTISKDNSHITIVSGGAQGADEIGRLLSVGYNFEYIEFPALWEDLTVKNCKVRINKNGDKYNCLAGFNRNTDIVENSDIILAFWDLESRETLDSIKKARERNKEVYIYYYEKESEE